MLGNNKSYLYRYITDFKVHAQNHHSMNSTHDARNFSHGRWKFSNTRESLVGNARALQENLADLIPFKGSYVSQHVRSNFPAECTVASFHASE